MSREKTDPRPPTTYTKFGEVLPCGLRVVWADGQTDKADIPIIIFRSPSRGEVLSYDNHLSRIIWQEAASPIADHPEHVNSWLDLIYTYWQPRSRRWMHSSVAGARHRCCVALVAFCTTGHIKKYPFPCRPQPVHDRFSRFFTAHHEPNTQTHT